MNRAEVRLSVATCTLCSLHQSSSGPIPFRGSDRPTIAIIAEAPGRVEDEQRKVLVGPSGQLLSSWLDRAQIDESDCSFLNAVSCFPNRTPSAKEVSICKTNLLTQLSYLSPSFLLVLGGVALSSFWSSLRMGDARGLWWKANIGEGLPRIWSIATYHPAAVLRNSALDGFVTRDLNQLKLASVLKRPPNPHPSYRCIMCGGFLNVLRDHDGNSVGELSGEKSEGSLAWCAKHDGLRMGTAGRGRETSSKTGSSSSNAKPRKRAASSTKRSTSSTGGSVGANQTSINIEKYRVR